MTDELFNPDEFLQSATDQTLSTALELVPEGDYKGIITAVGGARKITPSDPEKRPFASVDVTFTLDAPEVAATLGRKTLNVKYQLLVDLDAAGKLDASKGRNVNLGRLREACGQNQPGQPWAWTMLVGQGPLAVRVEHEPDRKNPEIKYERVKRVGKLPQ